MSCSREHFEMFMKNWVEILISGQNIYLHVVWLSVCSAESWSTGLESPYLTSCDCHEIRKKVVVIAICYWQVTAQDLEDTYQPPFKTCIQEACASCLMCACNQVNGVPMCARKDLLQKTRDEWGFKGYAACPNSEFVCLEPWTLNMSGTTMNFIISTPDPSIFIIVYVCSFDSLKVHYIWLWCCGNYPRKSDIHYFRWGFNSNCS